MLDRQYQIDPNYFQAHHVERLRAAEAARLAIQAQAAKLEQSAQSEPGLKDRVYNAVGDRLIAWGQKLKKETSYNDLCQDCA